MERHFHISISDYTLCIREQKTKKKKKKKKKKQKKKKQKKKKKNKNKRVALWVGFWWKRIEGDKSDVNGDGFYGLEMEVAGMEKAQWMTMNHC